MRIAEHAPRRRPRGARLRTSIAVGLVAAAAGALLLTGISSATMGFRQNKVRLVNQSGREIVVEWNKFEDWGNQPPAQKKATVSSGHSLEAQSENAFGPTIVLSDGKHHVCLLMVNELAHRPFIVLTDHPHRKDKSQRAELSCDGANLMQGRLEGPYDSWKFFSVDETLNVRTHNRRVTGGTGGELHLVIKRDRDSHDFIEWSVEIKRWTEQPTPVPRTRSWR